MPKTGITKEKELFMKKKNKIVSVLAAVLSCILLVSLIGCGGSGAGSGADSGSGTASTQSAVKIAVPSDTTNEARALLLLEAQGLIKLRAGAGLTATTNDILDNPYGIEFIEAEAAMLPRTLEDVDFAVINGNYALGAGIDISTALAGEDPNSAAALEFGNIIAVRAEDANSEKTRILVETLQGPEVQKFIQDTYQGAVIGVNAPATFSGSAASSGDKVIRVGASPAPHAEILEFARPLIEAQGYTLEIIEFSDYVLPNVALTDGDIDANYFQHVPYLDDYNKENGTTIVSAGKIHFEPLSIYPGRLSSLDDIKK